MTQGTSLFTRLYYPRETYEFKSDVENDLKKVNERIATIKSDMRVLAYMTEPNKFKDEEVATDYFIDQNVNRIFEELEELFVLRFKLEKLIDVWDESHYFDDEYNMELGIEVPDDYRYKSFMSGDFVRTDKHPTMKSLLE